MGDDRVLLFRDGRTIAGLGRPIELKPWHVAQLRLPHVSRSRARRSLATVIHRLDRTLGPPFSRWSRTAHKALRRVRDLGNLEVDIAELGAPRDGHARATPDVLLLLETHTRTSVVAEPADPEQVPARLAAHVAGELEPTLRIQRSIDYVSPGEGWQDVHRAPEVALEILEEAVRDIPAWVVRHPYPCSLSELHAVISRLAAKGPR